VTFNVGIGLAYYAFKARCVDRGGAEHVCNTDGSYYVLLNKGGYIDPGFAIWYNDPEKALEELGIRPEESGEVFGATLRLCVSEARGIAVLVSDRVENRVYVFPHFDWRLRYVRGLAFVATHNLARALVSYFGNGRDALAALALARLCGALRRKSQGEE